jgi:hypothetical protein
VHLRFGGTGPARRLAQSPIMVGPLGGCLRGPDVAEPGVSAADRETRHLPAHCSQLRPGAVVRSSWGEAARSGGRCGSGAVHAEAAVGIVLGGVAAAVGDAAWCCFDAVVGAGAGVVAGDGDPRAGWGVDVYAVADGAAGGVGEAAGVEAVAMSPPRIRLCSITVVLMVEPVGRIGLRTSWSSRMVRLAPATPLASDTDVSTNSELP